MGYTLPVRPERFARLAKSVFDGQEAISATGDWLNKVNMSFRLGELGIEKGRLEEMAASAVRVSPWVRRHPRNLGVREIARIYKEAY